VPHKSGGPGPIEWLFRDRTTGRLTIAQVPNAALGLFLIAASLRWLFNPAGSVGAALDVVATGALIWWSVDELARGVNPWRRLLGGVVLAGQILNIVA
jgi:hypothetical protein